MKILDVKIGVPYEEKVNFIDKNDVFVGYDLGQDCCEEAGWFISDKIEHDCDDGEEIREGLEDYYFVKDFFEGNEDEDFNNNDTYMAIFKITDGKNEKYLHLYNCHNGYYCHNFEVKHGDEIVNDGSL